MYVVFVPNFSSWHTCKIENLNAAYMYMYINVIINQ